MSIDLTDIDTVIIVMMENRSFDHLLGYLSLAPHHRPVDGLINNLTWSSLYQVPHGGAIYTPWNLTDGHLVLPGDPLHERVNIAVQLGAPTATATASMKGFIDSCSISLIPPGGDGQPQPLVMSYFTDLQVPTSHFFADNYTICERWFAPLPAGTQPNRLMALSGYSLIDTNHRIEPLAKQDLVYDWLTRNQVRWRVYHEGVPFIMSMDDWVAEWLVSDHFRGLPHLAEDVQGEPDATYPQVIFVEPTYTSAPHLGQACDDHPTTPICNGQDFLLRVYTAMTANPQRWAKSLMIVTYDEHGGFFDHVPPLALDTAIPAKAEYSAPMRTTGVRVPAFLISPFAQASGVYSQPLDHTAILTLLAQRFGNGTYSPDVAARGQVLTGSIADALQSTPQDDVPIPEHSGAGYDRAWELGDPNAQLYSTLLSKLKVDSGEALKSKLPTLFSTL